MAEEPEAAASEETPSEGEGKGKSKKSLMLGGILLGVMLLEGGGLFLGMKFLGAGPQQAPGGEGLLEDGSASPSEKPEVPIAKIKVPNRQSGKTYLYDVEVAATLIVPEGKEVEAFTKEVTEKIQRHENGIRDRLSYLIRSAKPEHLDEPGLVMMRRLIRTELGRLLGEDKLFDTILLPRWTPMRTQM